MAVWSTRFINDLPDSSFLYIAPGGKKDSDGKTTPRSLRHFPVKDANGKIDLPHLRNAIARIPQSNLSRALKDRLQRRARRMLEEATKEKKAMSKIEVRKVELLEGEELNALIKKVIDAIARAKGKLNKSLGLSGIFKDHIIARDWETGRYFKMTMKRDSAGEIELGEPVEVRQAFIPVGDKKKEDAGECLVAVDGEVTVCKAESAAIQQLVVDVADGDAPDYQDTPEEEKSLWAGIL